jgi:hypothetical protein
MVRYTQGDDGLHRTFVVLLSNIDTKQHRFAAVNKTYLSVCKIASLLLPSTIAIETTVAAIEM